MQGQNALRVWKVSIATALKEGLVVDMRYMSGNPYDGHTLTDILEQAGTLICIDKPPATAIVDKGYREAGCAHSDVRTKVGRLIR